MKMTLHIDDRLLKRVISAHGYASKTEAVHRALEELDRKARFREMTRTGLNLTAHELKKSVDPRYDVLALRVAERPATYGARHARPRARR